MDQLFREPIGIRQADLSDLHFRMGIPHPWLKPWIELYYSTHRVTGSIEDKVFNLYPDGGTTLSLSLLHGEVVDMRLNSSHQLRQTNVPDPRQRLSVRFRPGGVFALLGIPADDLEYPLGARDHPALQELSDQWNGRFFPMQSFAALDRFFLIRAKAAEQQPAIIQPWLDHFPEHPRVLRDILSGRGIQRRKLERAFRLETGLSPGQLFRILRVKMARRLLRSRPDLSVSHVAQACDYFDHPHFVREFSRVTHQTPGQYRARKLSQIYKSP